MSASVAPLPCGPSTELTVASTWIAASGNVVDDDLVSWPPDVFAFTEIALDRSEAYRFVVSPPPGRDWPPSHVDGWSDAVETAARNWNAWALHKAGEPPDLVVREWEVLRRSVETPLEDVTSGRAWRLCQALLTLHAISDQACAGVGPRPDLSDDAGIAFGARVRELLARTGSMARIQPGLLRVLPKYRTPSGGISSRSISRYASVAGPAVDVSVHQVGARTPGREPGELNILLLPWPLQVSDGDFRQVPGSVKEREIEPFGYFEFRPSEPFDFSLVDGLLAAAAEHVERVDVVVLPESALAQEDLPGLEDVLSRRGVTMLVAGLRDTAEKPGGLGSNWVHFGASIDGEWWHYRQDKHHRWSLERTQIEQYHLVDVLDPRVRWWEAMELRRRSVQLIERGDGHTVASLVCEDLAHIDEVVDLLCLLGPSLVVALLLDGPQLASRWTARYASVLADDAGSAVLTLSSYGMVRRAWNSGQRPSSVVALWKDRTRGVREITLDLDAQGILLTAAGHRSIRRAADGRLPESNVTDLRLAGVA
jgi:hypothetical protein